MTVTLPLNVSVPFAPALSANGLLLGAAACCLTVSTLLRAREAAVGRTVSVLLRCEGRSSVVRALVDTGNTLRDAVTGERVLIVDERAAQRLFPPGVCPTGEELRHPERALERLAGEWDARRLRLLPYRAVGVERGLLLAVRADDVRAAQGGGPGRLVALMPGVLEGGCHGLIGV